MKIVESKHVITKSDLIGILLILIYRISLDIIYCNYVYVRFGYYHFNLTYDVFYCAVSYVYLVLMAIFVPGLFRRGRISDLIIGVLIMMYYVPYTSLFAYSYHSIPYSLFVVGYFGLLTAFNRTINFEKVRFKGLGKGIGDTKVFLIIVIVFGLIRVLTSGIYSGFRITFDLSDYYEYRAEAREYAMPEILRYLLGWSTTAVSLGLMYSLINKKRFLIIYTLICTILDFSFSGKKSILFSAILSITISLLYKEKYRKWLPAGFTAAGLVGCLELTILGEDAFICKHFIRRLLFIPPHMSILHHDFFSTHEFDYLRSSVLRRFGAKSPYASFRSIPRLIGAMYFPRQSLAMNANTGLCGDAFANFGYLSILFAPLVIVMTFKILERCGHSIDRRIQVMVAISVAYSFANGSYFTLLLTNGVLFLMVLVFFLGGNERRSLNKYPT